MWLPDSALDHLQEIAEQPDFSQTKYRVLSALGRGGMGCVYRGEDTELDREVALKVLSDPEPSPQALERLRQEARILARLEHPSIVPIHDVGSLPDGRLYYAMKRVRGSRLDTYLETRESSLPERLRIFEKICEAIAFAHCHGVIHRDLKPANIMVGAFGEVLVMDWGVAKVRRGAPTGETAISAGKSPVSTGEIPASPAKADEIPSSAGFAALEDSSSLDEACSGATLSGNLETAHGTLLTRLELR